MDSKPAYISRILESSIHVGVTNNKYNNNNNKFQLMFSHRLLKSGSAICETLPHPVKKICGKAV